MAGYAKRPKYQTENMIFRIVNWVRNNFSDFLYNRKRLKYPVTYENPFVEK